MSERRLPYVERETSVEEDAHLGKPNMSAITTNNCWYSTEIEPQRGRTEKGEGLSCGKSDAFLLDVAARKLAKRHDDSPINELAVGHPCRGNLSVPWLQ